MRSCGLAHFRKAGSANIGLLATKETQMTNPNDTIVYLNAMRKQSYAALEKMNQAIGQIEATFASKPAFAASEAWQQLHTSMLKHVRALTDEVKEIESLLNEELDKLG